MNRQILCAAAIFLVAALAASAASSDSGFPFNGGFERVENSQPQGWDLTGTWLLGSPGACEGKKYCYLCDTVARAGDQMVSQGYRIVKTGDTVVLNVAYQSSTGGAILGLMLCDSLGRFLFPMMAEPLPAATSWTSVQRRFLLDPEKCPRNFGAVRVFLSVAGTSQAASFDAVSLTVEGAVPCPSGARVPILDVLSRPNLLPNPDLEATVVTPVAGWCPLEIPGSAAIQPIWLSEPVAVDLSLPYTVTTQVPDGVGADSFRLMARVCDPQDPSSVWLQTPGATSGPAGAPAVHLSRLERESQVGLVQVAVVPLPGQTLPAHLQIALRPEPLSLAVRPIAMAGEFEHAGDVTLFVTAVNNTSSDLAPTAHLKVTDAAGNQVSYEPRALKIGAHSAAYFPVKPKLNGAGDYTLLVHVLQNGHDLGVITYAFKVTGN